MAIATGEAWKDLVVGLYMMEEVVCWRMEEEEEEEKELRGRVEKSRKVGQVRVRGISGS